MAPLGLKKTGMALASYGSPVSQNSNEQTRIQKVANTLGKKIYLAGEKSQNHKIPMSSKLIRRGLGDIENSVRRVLPKTNYRKY